MNEGFVAVAKDVKLSVKQSFAGRDGQVYRFQLQGFGFTAWFNGIDRSDFEALPDEGTFGTCFAELEPLKDGSFKLVRPRFEVASATGSKDAAGKATSRSVA